MNCHFDASLGPDLEMFEDKTDCVSKRRRLSKFSSASNTTTVKTIINWFDIEENA
jgi:hypothetical protein